MCEEKKAADSTLWSHEKFTGASQQNIKVTVEKSFLQEVWGKLLIIYFFIEWKLHTMQ